MQENWNDLMLKTIEGDSHSYEQLLIELNKFLKGFLVKFAYNEEDREDLLQNILISLHLSRSSFDKTLEFRPWFFTLVHHRVVDYIRKNKKKILSSNLNEDKINVDYQILINELSKELDSRELEILTKIFINGEDAEDLANKMNISVNNLRVIIHRLKAKIISKLEG